MNQCQFCNPDFSKECVIYQDDVCYVMEDREPKAPIHWLLIPRTHVKSLAECDTLMLTHLSTVLIKSLLPLINNPYHILINGHLTVPHLHIHILSGVDLKMTKDDNPLHQEECNMSRK